MGCLPLSLGGNGSFLLVARLNRYSKLSSMFWTGLYHTHPERFVNGAPTPTPLLGAVWINPPPSIHNRGETVFTNFLTAVSQTR